MEVTTVDSSRPGEATEATHVEPVVVTVERDNNDRASERFRTLLGVMIAIVTVIGAFVAWRSALAATEAGNADDAGIIAALNTQETNTLSDIVSSQHRTSYLEYWQHKQQIERLAEDGSLENIPEGDPGGVVRQVTEAADLATASKLFFPSRYLNPDGTYNATKERAETLAEEAQRRDMNAQQHFDEANQWRDKSLALVVSLVVLGIALWLFALAETIEHRIKYVLALGGLGFLLLGAGAALAIETNVSLADVYSVGTMLALVMAVLVVLGVAAVLVVAAVEQPGLSMPAGCPMSGPWIRRYDTRSTGVPVPRRSVCRHDKLLPNH